MITPGWLKCVIQLFPIRIEVMWYTDGIVCHHRCVWPRQSYPQNLYSKPRYARSSVQRTHWVVSKVFLVTSFGLESGNISVSLLVLDLSSYVNAIQFFLCAFLVGQATMSTCSNISNGLLVRRVDYSPPCCFCDYRVRNMLRSLLRDFCSLHKAECM